MLFGVVRATWSLVNCWDEDEQRYQVQLMNNYCLTILVMLTVELEKGSITSPGCRCWGPTWSHGVVIAGLCVGLSKLRS